MLESTMTANQPATSAIDTYAMRVTICGQVLNPRLLKPAVGTIPAGPWLTFRHEGRGCAALGHDFPEWVVQAARRPDHPPEEVARSC
jgi:hypothetical protein